MSSNLHILVCYISAQSDINNWSKYGLHIFKPQITYIRALKANKKVPLSIAISYEEHPNYFLFCLKISRISDRSVCVFLSLTGKRHTEWTLTTCVLRMPGTTTMSPVRNTVGCLSLIRLLGRGRDVRIFSPQTVMFFGYCGRLLPVTLLLRYISVGFSRIQWSLSSFDNDT